MDNSREPTAPGGQPQIFAHLREPLAPGYCRRCQYESPSKRPTSYLHGDFFRSVPPLGGRGPWAYTTWFPPQLSRRQSHDTNCHSRSHRLHGAGTDQNPAPPSRGRDRRRDESAGRPAAHRHDPPLVDRRLDLRLEDLSPAEVAARAECVFSCLPHGASASVIPHLFDAGRRVVDFSADYRLNDPEVYDQWYGQKHADPHGWARSSTGCPSCSASRSRGPVGGQSGLLSHVGHLGLGAAVEGGPDRSEIDHRRLEERRFRRRPHAEADDPLSRVQREHLGLQCRPAPPHARDRPGSGHRRGHGRSRSSFRPTWSRWTAASSPPPTRSQPPT